MDLGVLLDATEEIEVVFGGEVVHLIIYSLGGARLTSEQRQPIAELFMGEIEDRGKYAKFIEAARASLPLLVKSWDVTWRGEPLSPQDINDLDENENRKYPIPDDLIVAINEKIREVTERPTSGSEQPQDGSQLAEKQDSPLVLNTTA